jgi:PAS domain S-box-containing protein
MFGWSDTEVVGKPLWVIVPERFRSAHEEGLARVVASGETKIIGKTVEVFGLHKSGNEFPIELSLAT